MTSDPLNPRLYFRTLATKQSGTHPDPAVDFSTWIAAFPAAQILEFEDEKFFIESIKRIGQNNITYDPQSNPDGTFLINSQFNGLLGRDIRLVIAGDADQTAKINKIDAFQHRLQKEMSHHKHGSAGLYFPPVPALHFDPTDTKGYYIDNDELFWESRKKSFVSTTLMLKFGGTI